MIKSIINKDESFITIFYRPLRGGDKSFIDSIFNHSTDFDFDRDDAAVTVNDITLSRAQLAKELAPAAPLLVDGLIMNFICLMLKWRDRIISTNYSDVNHGSSSFAPLRLSIFLPSRMIQRHLKNETILTEEMEMREYVPNLFNTVSSGEMGQLFSPCYVQENGVGNPGRWVLLVVNFIEENVYYIDPTLVPHNATPNNLPLVVSDTINSLKQLFQSARNELAKEIDILSKTLNPWPHQYYSAFHPIDSGIAVVSFMYFLVNGCPLYLSSQNLHHARYNFAYWICCNGSLPY